MIAAALLLLLAVPQAPLRVQNDRIAKVMGKTDGKTRETAYKVKSVDDEYEILRRLGLRPNGQSLVMDDKGHPYDMLQAVDPATGKEVELWFDIGSFFGKGLF
jgi:hypothetical protein